MICPFVDRIDGVPAKCLGDSCPLYFNHKGVEGCHRIEEIKERRDLIRLLLREVPKNNRR